MKLNKIVLLIALCLGCVCQADAISSGVMAGHSAMDMENSRAYSRNGDARAYVEPISDPLEPMNRTFHGLNKVLVDYLVYPVGKVYRLIVPVVVSDCISNFFNNLQYPLSLVNNSAQGKFRYAWSETERFVINTTIGLGGIFDPAASWAGIPRRNEDFGQTFGHYGCGPGYYLNLPVMGPSNVRDLIGMICGIPFNISYVYSDSSLSDMAFRSIGLVNNVFISSPSYKYDLETSYDTYVMMRTASVFMREAQIREVAIPKGMVSEPEESIGCMLLNPKDPLFWEKCDEHRIQLPGADRSLPVSCWPSAAGQHRLIFILPGLGGHRLSSAVCALAEIYRNAGWSVMSLSSTMHADYFLGLERKGFPGDFSVEATELPKVLELAMQSFNQKYPDCAVTSCSILGYSLGGLNTLALASSELPFTVDHFIAINPPRDPAYALSRIDAFNNIPQKWDPATRKQYSHDLFLRVAHLLNSNGADMSNLPISREESQFLIGLFMRLPLADILQAMGKERNTYVDNNEKNDDIAALIDFTWEDYLKRAIFPQMQTEGHQESFEELSRKYRVDSMADRLKNNTRLTVLHNENDFLLRNGDIEWYRSILGKRLIVQSRGSHLGNIFMPDYQKMLLNLTGDKLRYPPEPNTAWLKVRPKPLSRRVRF